MKNISYDLNPRKWEEYYDPGNLRQKAAKWISGGVKTMPRAIFISGHSGCGKTAFALLLIRSIRCLNRKDDEIEPCGVCAACLGDDPRYINKEQSQIYWIQSGNYEDESVQKQVKTAIAGANKGSRITNRIDRDMVIVVADEWHLVPSPVRQEFLQRAEVEIAHNNVVYIFITMQEEKLPLQDRIAMVRRSAHVKVHPFSVRHIQEFLLMKFPDCPPESAALIAENSEGSLGLGIAILDNIRDTVDDLSVDIVAHELSLATNQQRWEIWQALLNSNKFSHLNFLLEGLSIYIDSFRLSKQLIQDVLRTCDILDNVRDDQLFAINLLTQYQSNPYMLSLVNYLVQLRGLSLVSKEAVFGKEENTLDYI